MGGCFEYCKGPAPQFSTEEKKTVALVMCQHFVFALLTISRPFISQILSLVMRTNFDSDNSENQGNVEQGTKPHNKRNTPDTHIITRRSLLSAHNTQPDIFNTS